MAELSKELIEAMKQNFEQWQRGEDKEALMVRYRLKLFETGRMDVMADRAMYNAISRAFFAADTAEQEEKLMAMTPEDIVAAVAKADASALGWHSQE